MDGLRGRLVILLAARIQVPAEYGDGAKTAVSHDGTVSRREKLQSIVNGIAL